MGKSFTAVSDDVLIVGISGGRLRGVPSTYISGDEHGVYGGGCICLFMQV